MLKRAQVTPAGTEVVLHQTLGPFETELSPVTPFQGVRKRLLGAKTVERANRQRLIEATAQNVLEILGVTHKADPVAEESHDLGYVESVELPFDDSGSFERYGMQVPQLEAKMIFDIHTNRLRPHEDVRSLDVRVKGTSNIGQSVDERREFRVFGEDDVRIPRHGNAVFPNDFIPIGELPIRHQVTELYDFTARLANGIMAAQAAGTLAIHGTSDLITRL